MKKNFVKYSLLLMISTIVIIGFSGCWKKNTYTVTFDSMGGSIVDPQIVTEGESVFRPENPQKEGFTFVEWQLDGKGYDFNSTVANNLLLTAYYTINENTEIVLIMLDYQNGKETEIVEIINGGTMTEPPTPLKHGYKFVGWFYGDSKYNFSSVVSENILLTAKWEVDKNINSPQKNDKESGTFNPNDSDKITSSDNNTTQSDNNSNEQSNITNYDNIINQYAGRWYLNGYADVCIDVSKNLYYDAMDIESYNFSFSVGYESGNHLENTYLIYPFKSNNIMGYGAGISILFQDWNKRLAEENIVLGKDCIYIDHHKFVREKGTKDRYYDTCYKDAVGTWYLHNSPNSILEINADKASNLTNSDTFFLKTTLFDLKTFATNISTSHAGSGRADRKSDWDKYGISVSDGVLTITNSNGSRKFSKTKTYIKVKDISLNETKLELFVNDTKKLTATIMPSDAYYKEVTWSSSNSSVATVSSSGVVTAKGAGSAIITVKSTDGNYTAKCHINVSVPRAKSISLNKNSIEFYKGDSETLIATIIPSNAVDKTVSWSSSDDSVVSVSPNGKITAKKQGIATITVTTKDGGHTATCSVVVKQNPLKVSANIGITTKYTSNSIQKGISVTAKATDGSENYVTYSIKLYRDEAYIGEVSSNEMFVTPFMNGTYTAEVYVKDSSGNEATTTQTTTISVS